MFACCHSIMTVLRSLEEAGRLQALGPCSGVDCGQLTVVSSGTDQTHDDTAVPGCRMLTALGDGEVSRGVSESLRCVRACG